jgi:hypothetical protein
MLTGTFHAMSGRSLCREPVRCRSGNSPSEEAEAGNDMKRQTRAIGPAGAGQLSDQGGSTFPRPRCSGYSLC